MINITGILHNAVLVKVTAVLLSIAMVAGVFQLSGAFQAHASNVHVEIKADPPGLVKIVDQTGNPPPVGVSGGGNPPAASSGGDTGSGTTSGGDTGTGESTASGGGGGTQGMPAGQAPPGQEKKAAGGGGGAAKPQVVNPNSNRPTILTINTPVEFGTVFRGEELQGEFKIGLSGTANTTNPNPPYETPASWVLYTLTMTQGAGGADLTDYLTLVKKETDAITDNVTSALLLATSDEEDIWLVKLDLSGDPDLIADGDYHTVITISVIAYQ